MNNNNNNKIVINRAILCFKNGVYDFKNKNFTNIEFASSRTPMTTGYDYKPCDPNKKIILMDIIDKIIPDSEIKVNALKWLFYSLYTKPDKLLHLLIGAGSNGKTTLISLIKSVMGKYYGTVDASHLENLIEYSGYKTLVTISYNGYENIDKDLLRDVISKFYIIIESNNSNILSKLVDDYLNISEIKFPNSFVKYPQISNLNEFEIDETILSQIENNEFRHEFFDILLDQNEDQQ